MCLEKNSKKTFQLFINKLVSSELVLAEMMKLTKLPEEFNVVTPYFVFLVVYPILLGNYGSKMGIHTDFNTAQLTSFLSMCFSLPFSFGALVQSMFT